MFVFPLPGISDNIAPGGAAYLLTEVEHRVDIGLEVPPTVPPEHELVRVDVDVLLAQSVICPVAPAFEVGEDAVYPWKNFVSWRRVYLTQVYRDMVALQHPPVGGVAIGKQDGADGSVLHDERMQTFAIDIYDPLQPHPSRISSFTDFDRADHEYLADRAFVLAAAFGFVFRPEWNVGLIDLDDAAQRTASRIDHGSPQRVEQQPRGLVSYAKLRLELQGRDTVRVRRYKVGREEPLP